MESFLPNPGNGMITVASTIRTGKMMSLKAPVSDDIDIHDIAVALSNCCHWVGHCKPGFNVAQHSVLTLQLTPVNRRMKFAALMHDAAEAYLGDVSKPLKMIIEEQTDVYKVLETQFMTAICSRFDIDQALLKAIKPYDMQAQAIEYEHFFIARNGNSLTQLERIFGTENTCWTAEVAEDMFLDLFNQYVTL